MRVLVTGANGFIGGYLTQQIKDMGWGLITSYLDVSDMEAWQHFDNKENIDAVIHLAALLMIDGHRPEDYFKVNTLGTYNLLEFARRNKIPKFIYAMTHSDTNRCSSVYIHDDEEQRYGTNSFERNSISFITSKIAAADMVDTYTDMGILNGVNLRLANIRGYGSKDTRFNSPFHQFIAKAQKGEDIEIWGNPPTTERDMIYVKDVVSAIIKSVENPGIKGWYNIGSGKGMTIVDEAMAIIKVFCAEQDDCFVCDMETANKFPDFPVRVVSNYASKIIYRQDIEEVRKKSCVFLIDKAKRDLNWEPAYSYEDGLRDMKTYMERG